MFSLRNCPEQLFKDEQFCVASTRLLEDVYGLYPAERQLVQHATYKRRAEFSAGRDCARRALSYLGKGLTSLLPDESGCPLWPKNYVGSISHTQGYAIAVVAKQQYVSAVGVDIECWSKSTTSWTAISKVCSPQEQQWVSAQPENKQRLAAHILFSIREAVYKCIYSLLKIKLGFNDLVIAISQDENIFSAELTSVKAIPCLTGVFGFNQDYVFSTVWIPTIHS